jgi:DNA-binding MarR family transcriptional regulator
MKKVKPSSEMKADNMPGFLLWQISKLWQQQLELTFQDLDLSHTQAILLANIVRLTDEGEKVTQILLSKKTSVDPVTTSQTVRVLEKKEIIKRVVSSEDKRAFILLPTKKGDELKTIILQRLPTLQKHFFCSIENELDTLIILLQQLIDANK